MARTTGKVNLSLLMPVLLVGGVFFLLREFKNIIGAAGDVAKTGIEKGKEVGQNISKAIAEKTLPDFDTAATVIKATAVRRTQGTTSWNAYTCPPGYRYKKVLTGEHLCFRE